ncbi:hypothetical protein BpHYR1_032852 [Brachionus plicatilis]|uniref:SWIM-type domain-containing protein n=1 Tax=Brachionus plicatilis TaxID=10195 RepID=A0A3M7Q4C4_BRAPC|nr:hypothetical protein BpHYR1_032852 [Brachionus plicatilis]
MEEETSSQSSQSSSTRGLDWDLLRDYDDESDLEDALVTKLPYNTVRSSHSKSNCNLKSVYNDLIHPESHAFGIHPKVKTILNDLVEKNILYLKPLQALIYLNTPEVINNEMKGLPMPDRNQIKYYIRSYRNINNVFSNKLEDVKQLIKKHVFNYDLDDIVPFFFGYSLDDFNEPIIGNGDNQENAFRIGITSKKLINQIPALLVKNMVFHLDCTYKLTKNRFPFLVFGFSDFSGQFHPVAYALISHETGSDFDWFFGALKNLFISYGIVFNPVYMMMDASDASYNAVKLHFPNCIILMCFFHVQYNIKKNSKFYPIACQDDILNHVRVLNSCTSYDEFCRERDLVLDKWDKMGLLDFKNYFEKEWLSERWWRWQLFQVVPGYPTTNSCIESHNKLIKLLYTNYICYTIHEMLKVVMDKIVNYYSRQFLEIKYFRAPTTDTISRAKELNHCLFIKYGNSDKSYLYDNKYYLMHDINLIYHKHHYCSCTCKDFYRHFVCKHTLALSAKLKLTLKGFVQVDFFATRAKPGKKKAKSNPLSYD